ncbi:putative ribonuclease H-like domain-containing protein [Tanacetum coccineum]
MGEYVTFRGRKGYISGKGKIRVGNLDFDIVKELGHFNLFSISQICDKQHKVLCTETECLVVSSDFKMPDENQILLKVPRHHNMYSFDMKSHSPGKRVEEKIALKHLGTVPKNNTTSTPSVNTGSQTVNTGRLDHDDSLIPTPTLRIHSIHPTSQILGDPKSAVQTRSKVQNKSGAHALLSHIQKQQRNNHKDQQHCLFACFLSQEEPKKIAEALQDDNLPHGMKVIDTKWVYRNKRDERGVVVRNKARLVAQGYTQEEGIDYDEVLSIRDSLQLEDATGITMLPNDELFEGMGQIGYPTDGTFTFWKSFFTPQWRYLVHHLLHCISSKSGGWDQFGSNIATALICLSTDRVYNFSKLIFDGMVAN